MRAIHALGEINKGLRVINELLNVICENQKCFLAVCKETITSCSRKLGKPQSKFQAINKIVVKL